MAGEVNEGIVVAQLGARMHYAVPRELHARGFLRRLLTDLYLTSGLWHKMYPTLRRYKAVGLPSSKVASRSVGGVAVRLSNNFGKTPAWRLRSEAIAWNALSKLMKREQRERPVSTVYAFDTAAHCVFQHTPHARKILEQCVATRKAQLDLDACFVSNGWLAPSGERERMLRLRHEKETEEQTQADLIVCASDFVAESLRDNGVSPDKIAIVPYGFTKREPLDNKAALKSSKPTVLFAGQVGFRKGAYAISEVAKRLPGVQFRLAGVVSDEVRNLAFPDNVQLLGRLSFERLTQEMQLAWLFFLPSWLEGSATVTYEALAFGLPVVTTPNSGSVVRHKQDGFIYQPDDHDGFVEGISLLVENQTQRDAMSQCATARATEFTSARYGERLMSVLFS